MSLAALIREQSAPARPACKTCLMLDRLTDEDRADFTAAVQAEVAGSVLARAITARLKELDIDDSLGAGSVRTHIDQSHRP